MRLLVNMQGYDTTVCLGTGTCICIFQYPELTRLQYTQIYTRRRQVLLHVMLLSLLYTEGLLAKLTSSVKMWYENAFFREGERLTESENVKFMWNQKLNTCIYRKLISAIFKKIIQYVHALMLCFLFFGNNDIFNLCYLVIVGTYAFLLMFKREIF